MLDAGKKLAGDAVKKMACYFHGHTPVEKAERIQEKPAQVVRITISCARCGVQLENPHVEWEGLWREKHVGKKE